MVREFEHRHMVRQKCAICGCKNKVHTELLDNLNNFIGYSLKCCACGNYMEFLLDYKNNGEREVKHHNGKQTCIQPSFCPRKDCKLYGSCINAYATDDMYNHIPHEEEKMPYADNEVIVSHHNAPRFL